MLNVILDKSFIHDFGFPICNKSKIIINILLNVKNICIISRELLDYIEDNIKSEFKEYWNNILIELSDKGKLKSSYKNTLDTDDIYNNDKTLSDFVIILKNENNNVRKDYECNLQDNSKLNSFLQELLQNCIITIRGNDFSNNKEIDDLFEMLFSCSRTQKRPIIISRYDKFSTNLITLIKKYFTKKEFWTTKKRNYCKTNDLNYLRKELGSKLMVYLGTNEQIHERKVILESLILEFDNDFDCITFDNKSWVGNCIIDSNLNKYLFEKRNNLEQFV